ncbi:multi-sensor signal transduction histidine kinase [Christiangramia gaetbulicola]|uniref:histidine kinase n=1 Tax=Christiangramia gaetbulicola TaxID=703340 RepID=A0A2T6AFU6_9FLAO|nr:ATP-binding protein [Christiangramia gaetbulicola]PTX42659.1 multi-sensor signal transduction histidine kinase [Christiangramia gaetbulicola]
MPENVQYPEKVDLSSCEKEPIHIIGATQSHGVLVSCNKSTGEITQIGENCKDIFGISAEDLLGKDLDVLLDANSSEEIKGTVLGHGVFEVKEAVINDRDFVVIPHISGENLILDIEPVDTKKNSFDFQKNLSSLLNTLSASETADELCEDAAKTTKSIFGYDRVMIYKFDEEWNGKVIAEEKNENMESWLGLHYPASDIPKQARELFLKNRVRIITDVNYSPVEIVPTLSPIDGKPLDLSNSKLRAVSPIHIEYLQNMQVGASLTAALISNGKLWGLLACHHSEAKYINYYQRQTCEFLIQIFSNELSLKNSNSFVRNVEKLDRFSTKLIDQVNQVENIKKGLIHSTVKVTDLFPCSGAAVVLGGKIKLAGNTPEKAQVKKLIKNFLAKKKDSLYFSRSLMQEYPVAETFKDKGSGILSIRLGQGERDFIIWFRPEAVQTVDWGGNPENKATYDKEKDRLTPRKSFEKWTEELTGVADAWKDFEINAARKLGESVSYIILENQKKEIDTLNNQLITAHNELELFSQGLSHDLKAPLRGIDGYAHILKEDHYADLQKEGQLAVDTILSSVEEMQDLIDNILDFAGVSNQDIRKMTSSVNNMIQDIFVSFNVRSNYPHTSIEVEENMPKIVGDKRMLSQIWSNLITNALKYSERSKDPKIEIGSKNIDRKTVYYVKDNGVGFDPVYSEKIFDLFSRYSGDNYKGTGIGLAIVKKIIEKHDGKIWADSELGKGTTFYFYV